MNQFDEHDDPHQNLTRRVIGAAIKFFRALGPGILESACEVCLADELTRQDRQYRRQSPLPVMYEGRRLDCGYRLDFLVEDSVIVELKCVEDIAPIHEAQLLTHLRLANKEVRLLINFSVCKLMDGVIRKVLQQSTTLSQNSAFSASLR